MAAKWSMVFRKNRLVSLLMILYHSAHLTGLSGRRGVGWESGKQLWGEEREAEKDVGFVGSGLEPELKNHCE